MALLALNDENETSISAHIHLMYHVSFIIHQRHDAMGGGDSLTFSSSAVQITVAAAAIGVGVGVVIGASWRRAELEAERRERKAEHDGRVRLQRSLRPAPYGGRPSAVSGGGDDDDGDGGDGVARIKKSVSDGGDDGESGLGLGIAKKVPRKRVNELGPPIGRVHSCFSRRNGTPRQGGDLVPSARCTFTLDDGLPKDLLAGLDEYSHCWVGRRVYPVTDKTH